MRRAALLAVVVLTACAMPTPVPPPLPVTSAPSPTFLGGRVPVDGEWTVETPANTYLMDASGARLVGLQAVVGPPGGFKMLIADAPLHEWRTAYSSAAAAGHTQQLVGADARWSFIEDSFMPGIRILDVVSVNVDTGVVTRLDRSTLSREIDGRLSPRRRPTIVGGAEFVAWTRVRMLEDGLLLELFETTLGTPDAPVRLVKSAREPLVPLAFDERLAYVVAGSDADELWVFSQSTGSQTRWATAEAEQAIVAAAWSDSGLLIARASSAVSTGATIAIVGVDGQGAERPIANSLNCAHLSAYRRYVTWSCGRTDLRAYDVHLNTYALVAHSADADNFHVANGAFVWAETIEGKTRARLVTIPQ